MNKIKFGKKVFEGENIIAYNENLYLVFDKETGQGSFIIPNIERYNIDDGVRVATPLEGSGQAFKVDLFCPNTKTLNHNKNAWERLDDSTIVCSECGAKMDISNIEGKAKLEENK